MTKDQRAIEIVNGGSQQPHYNGDRGKLEARVGLPKNIDQMPFYHFTYDVLVVDVIVIKAH
jgi:hypothetical protein